MAPLPVAVLAALLAADPAAASAPDIEATASVCATRRWPPITLTGWRASSPSRWGRAWRARRATAVLLWAGEALAGAGLEAVRREAVTVPRWNAARPARLAGRPAAALSGSPGGSTGTPEGSRAGGRPFRVTRRPEGRAPGAVPGDRLHRSQDAAYARFRRLPRGAAGTHRGAAEAAGWVRWRSSFAPSGPRRPPAAHRESYLRGGGGADPGRGAGRARRRPPGGRVAAAAENGEAVRVWLRSPAGY